MSLRYLLGGALGSGFKLPLPWMPSQSLPTRLPPVQLPRDERPHDRSIEWWHFMGSFRLLRAADDLPEAPAAPPSGGYLANPKQPESTSGHTGERDVPDAPLQPAPGGAHDKDLRTTQQRSGGPVERVDAASGPFVMSFVLSILKARVQGITKYASFVILVDHERKTHTISTKLGAPGAVCFEPTDGSAIRFHFGPPGVARPGPPEAWSVGGGMGIYDINIDVSRQIAMDLRQRDTPAVLVGSRPVIEADEVAPQANDNLLQQEMDDGDPQNDGVMQYLGGDQMGYYAFPALTLDGVLGTGADERAITGSAWMEHQWGDFPIGDYRWTYLAINFQWKPKNEGASKKAQLLVFHFRARSAASPSATQKKKYGVFIEEDGAYHILDNITVEPVKGSRSFGNYPVSTHVRWSPPGEKKKKTPKLDLTIEPIFDDQECRTDLPATIFPVFWEGACTVKGKVGDIDDTAESNVLEGESWAITELAGYE